MNCKKFSEMYNYLNNGLSVLVHGYTYISEDVYVCISHVTLQDRFSNIRLYMDVSFHVVNFCVSDLCAVQLDTATSYCKSLHNFIKNVFCVAKESQEGLE